jgi:hypothetical protein
VVVRQNVRVPEPFGSLGEIADRGEVVEVFAGIFAHLHGVVIFTEVRAGGCRPSSGTSWSRPTVPSPSSPGDSVQPQEVLGVAMRKWLTHVPVAWSSRPMASRLDLDHLGVARFGRRITVRCPSTIGWRSPSRQKKPE